MDEEKKMEIHSTLNYQKLQNIAWYGDALSNRDCFLYKGYWFAGVTVTFTSGNSPVVVVIGEYIGEDPRVFRCMIALKEEDFRESGSFKLSNIHYVDGDWNEAFNKASEMFNKYESEEV